MEEGWQYYHESAGGMGAVALAVAVVEDSERDTETKMSASIKRYHVRYHLATGIVW